MREESIFSVGWFAEGVFNEVTLGQRLQRTERVSRTDMEVGGLGRSKGFDSFPKNH